jgi:8-oxo-dGTP diphosphatase
MSWRSGPPMGNMTEINHPIPGAGIVVWRGDEVLLIKRGKPPFAGEWSIPGGKIEYGETAAEAALRELAEETGVTARITGLIDVIDSIGSTQSGTDSDWHYLLVDFAGVWVSGEPIAGDDAIEAGFFPLDDALRRTRWDKTRDVIGRSKAMIDALPVPQSVR